MKGPLQVDICQQEREIINGVPICIKLYLSSNPFRLIASADRAYKVIITDAILKVEVNPEVMVAHNEVLKMGLALYQIKQSPVKCYALWIAVFTLHLYKFTFRKLQL